MYAHFFSSSLTMDQNMLKMTQLKKEHKFFPDI